MMRGFAGVVFGAAAWVAAQGAASADPAPPCPPAARVAGDAELGHAVVLELSILGVASRDIPAGCAAVEVVVARSGDAVAVSLRDGAGRQAAEVVTDASVAAAWIESWLHPEIRDPLLAARAGAGIAAAPEVTATVSARAPAGRAGRFAYRGLVLGAAGEMSSASDGSDWRALSASLCARFGRWCAGLSARGADNRGMSADGGITEVNRWELSLSATMSASFSLGRMTLVPSAGVGLAYSETGRGGGSDCFGNVNPDGTACEGPYLIEDDFSAYSFGPRGELGLGGAFPIAGPLSLTLGVAMTFAPMARGEPVTPDYAADYFDKLENGGGDPSDPDQLPDDRMELYFAEESYQLPAEPSRFTRLSLGLAWEIE